MLVTTSMTAIKPWLLCYSYTKHPYNLFSVSKLNVLQSFSFFKNFVFATINSSSGPLNVNERFLEPDGNAYCLVREKLTNSNPMEHK